MEQLGNAHAKVKQQVSAEHEAQEAVTKLLKQRVQATALCVFIFLIFAFEGVRVRDLIRLAERQPGGL